MKKTFQSAAVIFTVILAALSVTACNNNNTNNGTATPAASVAEVSRYTIRQYYDEHTSDFQSIEQQLSSSQQTMKLYPDGDDTIVYECQILESDVSPSDELTSLFKSQFDQQRSNFEQQVTQLKENAGVDTLIILVKYVNASGDLLYEDSVS